MALGLPHEESFAREDFLQSASNASALALVEAWPDWPVPLAVIFGEAGVGKSHLAAIWAARAGARFLSGRALSSADLPIALATGALVLEDVSEGRVDETALFHLLNLAREQGAFVLITAPAAPAGWKLRTPDLASRLRAAPALEISTPDEALLRAVFVKLFADRQLRVDEALVNYLLARTERSVPAARALVDLLDHEALRRQRPITRALAAELLGPNA
ncbi:MAG: DNA replication protein [Rhodospirillales bacterium]|nr:DNA replication protein [Rhodospirillales bacterium]